MSGAFFFILFALLPYWALSVGSGPRRPQKTRVGLVLACHLAILIRFELPDGSRAGGAHCNRKESSVAVRIRLKRVGRCHHPSYRLAAMDSRRARDSRVIEELGSYHPVEPKEENQVTLKRERIEYWLSVGAKPTDTVRRLLVKQGVLPDSSGKSA